MKKHLMSLFMALAFVASPISAMAAGGGCPCGGDCPCGDDCPCEH